MGSAFSRALRLALAVCRGFLVVNGEKTVGSRQWAVGSGGEGKGQRAEGRGRDATRKTVSHFVRLLRSGFSTYELNNVRT
jgi:hypothetical protein